jgi:hypothetical protein
MSWKITYEDDDVHVYADDCSDNINIEKKSSRAPDCLDDEPLSTVMTHIVAAACLKKGYKF